MTEKKIIIVVCWGNIHRSPIAEHFINKKIKELGLQHKYICISRGIQGSRGLPPPKFPNLLGYEIESKAAMPSLVRYGIDLSKHEAKAVDKEIIEKASMVLAINEKVLSDPENGLLAQFPEDNKKIILITEFVGKTNDLEDLSGISDENKYDLSIDRINDLVNKSFLPLISKIEGQKSSRKEFEK